MTASRDNAIEIALLDAERARPAAVGAGAVPAGGAADGRTNIFDLDRTGLEDFFEHRLGEKRYRAH